MKTLLNPANGAKISTIVTGKQYDIAVGEMLLFNEDSVANELLTRYGFLQEVKMDPEPVKESTTPVAVKPVDVVDPRAPIKPKETEPAEQVFACSECEHKSPTKAGLLAHIRGKHSTVKPAVVEEVPVVAQEAPEPKLAEGIPVITPTMQLAKEQAELAEVLPVTGQVDRDGVEWTGNGLEDDVAGGTDI